MNTVIEAHLTCEICGDTWFRDMTEKQLIDYMAEHPQANFRKVTDPNDGTHVDLQGVICDGCEDFYTDQCEIAENEEIEAQYLDELKADACAAAGTGEFAVWHFDPELAKARHHMSVSPGGDRYLGAHASDDSDRVTFAGDNE